MQNFSNLLLDFFIPRICPGCKNKLPPYTRFICDDCMPKLRIPGKSRISHEFKKKFAGTGTISDFTVLYLFEKDKELQNIIHALKYGRQFLLGVFLGELLGKHLIKEFSNYQIDVVVPVPLHQLKQTEREYNQSYYIAKGVCKSTGLKTNNRLLKRIKYTGSQTTLKFSERQDNLKGAFLCRKKLKGENILIIDDVSTTGATLQECGITLLSAGAGKVYAAAIAVPD